MITALELERDLIPPNTWDMEWDMPREIKEIIAESVTSHPYPLGIGKNEKVGWFALGAGQGPYIIWTEKNNK